MVDLAATRARDKGVAPTTNHEGRQYPNFARASKNVATSAKLLNTLPYCQLPH
jgi:hypothetical protein